MSSKQKLLEQQFEQEMWLYLDGDLPKKKMAYWDEEIKRNPVLVNLIKETKNTLDLYDEINLDIDDNKFNAMIEQTVSKKYRWRFSNLIKTKNDGSALPVYKLAFASFLIIITITVTLLDEKPNPINKISDELLQWDDMETSKSISNIENSLNNSDEQYRVYMKYQMSKDPWKRSIYKIEKQINKIKNEINTTSL